MGGCPNKVGGWEKFPKINKRGGAFIRHQRVILLGAVNIMRASLLDLLMVNGISPAAKYFCKRNQQIHCI